MEVATARQHDLPSRRLFDSWSYVRLTTAFEIRDERLEQPMWPLY
jgi:hypothetical protein